MPDFDRMNDAEEATPAYEIDLGSVELAVQLKALQERQTKEREES